VFGDLGVGDVAEHTICLLNHHSAHPGFVSMILHIGDIGYNLHEPEVAA
jgi:hypothetical protein